MLIQKKFGRAVGMTLAAVAAMHLTACDLSNLLDAPNPSLLDPEAVQSAAGANAVRTGALSRLRTATAMGESSWMFGGLLADEWATSSTFVQNDETDQRSIQLNNGTVQGNLRSLYRVRTAANQAIALLNVYRPTPVADIAEMHFARGFAELQLASDFCNGIPLSDGSGTTPVLGMPLMVDSVFGAASASFDSAIALTASLATAADIAVNRAARIGKARALLGRALTNAPAAAALVAGIPTTYRYDVTASLTGGENTLWSQAASQNRYTVSDSAQGNNRSFLVANAVPFRSAADRRVPARYRRSGVDTVKSQDGNTFAIIVDSLWGQTSAVAVTHGIDARLIEAEAFLQAGDPANWLLTLNNLRGTAIQLTAPSPQAAGTHPGWTVPVMAALVDPGTAAGRVALHFREMAFWQFGRGHRLGNLRRMIRQYGYPADGSGNYPTGAHFKGGVYGADLNLPVTTDEQVGNPNFKGCIDRNA
jgi:hypothetical protein